MFCILILYCRVYAVIILCGYFLQKRELIGILFCEWAARTVHSLASLNIEQQLYQWYFSIENHFSFSFYAVLNQSF